MQDDGKAKEAEFRVYLGLGSSLGDRMGHLRDALRLLNCPDRGTRLLAISPVYETPHMGLAPEDAERYPAHLNCAALIAAALAPEALLARIQDIETQGQRQRAERWGPRTIDIDILLYENSILHTPVLDVPHPGLMTRIFALKPLSDLAPDLVLPDGQAIRELLLSDALREQPIKRVETHELLI